VVDLTRADDIARRFIRVDPPSRAPPGVGVPQAAETVFLDNERRERDIRLLDPDNVDANTFHVSEGSPLATGEIVNEALRHGLRSSPPRSSCQRRRRRRSAVDGE